MFKNQINKNVDYIQVILDKRVPFKLIQTSEGENIIFCKSFKEELFDSGFFSTKEKDFVHNYITENGQKYIVTDVTTPDDKIYKNVKFRVVVKEKGELPYSTFNPKEIITEKGEYKLPEKKQIITETTRPTKTQSKQLDLSENYKIKKQEQELLDKAKELQKRLIEEKVQLESERNQLQKQKLVVESEKIVSEKLSDYRQLILQEFFDVSEKQENIIKEKLSENYKILENKIYEQNKIQSENAKSALDILNKKNLVELKKQIDDKIYNKQKEIEKLVENKTEDVSRLLVEKADELKKLFDEKFILDLQNYKENLYLELAKISDEKTTSLFASNKENLKTEVRDFFKNEKQKAEKDFFDGIETVKHILEKTSEDLKSKTPELDEKIKIINEKIQELTEQKKNNQVLIGEAKTYTDKEIKKAFEESKSFARRILDLGGGGGSVAIQYAKGGTMDGDLNVTGHYLSAGVDLLNIFTGGGGGDPAVNALVYSNSAYWNTAYTNLVYNSANYLTGTAVNLGDIPSLSSNWNTAYTNLVYNSTAYLSGFNSTAITQNSANWNTAYTNLVYNSANYLTGASLNYVNTTFVKLSGDAMTGRLNTPTISTVKIESGAFIATSSSINNQTVTNYVLSNNDNGQIITLNSSSPITLAVSSGLPVGFNVMSIQIGTGQVSVSAGNGVTINSDGGKLKIASQHSAASLISYGANIFNLAGNLTA